MKPWVNGGRGLTMFLVRYEEVHDHGEVATVHPRWEEVGSESLGVGR